jgi:hypothetical protein
METLRVATNDLLAAANRWHGLSAELGGAAPSEVGLSCQASAAAVNAVHAGVAAAGAEFAERTQVTAVKTAAAGTAYASNEANSSALLGAITESL